MNFYLFKTLKIVFEKRRFKGSTANAMNWNHLKILPFNDGYGLKSSFAGLLHH